MGMTTRLNNVKKTAPFLHDGFPNDDDADVNSDGFIGFEETATHVARDWQMPSLLMRPTPTLETNVLNSIWKRRQGRWPYDRW